jgi:hypothetical protein
MAFVCRRVANGPGPGGRVLANQVSSQATRDDHGEPQLKERRFFGPLPFPRQGIQAVA